MPFFKSLALISLPLYVLDQITKWFIVTRFDPPRPALGYYDHITVIEGFFDISRVHNTGVAFGMFNGSSWANPFFTLVALTALGLFAFMWKLGAFPVKTSQVAVMLLIPGILGNLTDRIVHGYVVDFLSFDLQFMQWPSFNVADSCICIAAFLLFIAAWQTPPSSVPAGENAEGRAHDAR